MPTLRSVPSGERIRESVLRLFDSESVLIGPVRSGWAVLSHRGGAAVLQGFARGRDRRGVHRVLRERVGGCAGVHGPDHGHDHAAAEQVWHLPAGRYLRLPPHHLGATDGPTPSSSWMRPIQTTMRHECDCDDEEDCTRPLGASKGRAQHVFDCAARRCRRGCCSTSTPRLTSSRGPLHTLCGFEIGRAWIM